MGAKQTGRMARGLAPNERAYIDFGKRSKGRGRRRFAQRTQRSRGKELVHLILCDLCVLCANPILLASLATPARIRSAYRRARRGRSEEHTSELQSLMRTSYAVFCL